MVATERTTHTHAHEKKKIAPMVAHLPHGFRQADGGLVSVEVRDLKSVAFAVAKQNGRQGGRSGLVRLHECDIASLFGGDFMFGKKRGEGVEWSRGGGGRNPQEGVRGRSPTFS